MRRVPAPEPEVTPSPAFGTAASGLTAGPPRSGEKSELSNQIRGLMKTFGLVVPAGKGSRFEANVRALLADQEGLTPILLPLLEAWRAVRLRAAELGRQLVASARPRRL